MVSIKRSFYIKVEVEYEAGKGWSSVGKLSKLFKNIFFRRKVSFITYENDDVSKLPASN